MYEHFGLYTEDEEHSQMPARLEGSRRVRFFIDESCGNQPGHLGIDQSHVNMLPLTRPVAVTQSRQYPGRRVHAAGYRDLEILRGRDPYLQHAAQEFER